MVGEMQPPTAHRYCLRRNTPALLVLIRGLAVTFIMARGSSYAGVAACGAGGLLTVANRTVGTGAHDQTRWLGFLCVFNAQPTHTPW